MFHRKNEPTRQPFKHPPATISGLSLAYSYDTLGNRMNATVNSTSGNYYSAAGGTGNLGATALNAYGSRAVPRYLDLLGEVPANETVTVNGANETLVGGHWYTQWSYAGNNSAQWVFANVTGALGGNMSSMTGHLYLPAHPANFAYDADGNPLGDGVRWDYAWDGENRLAGAATNATAVAAGAPNVTVAYTYDSQNRLVARTVAQWNGTAWVTASSGVKLYDGTNLVYDAETGNKYCWGLDVSGSVGGAGGVGGLLMADLVSAGNVTNRVYYAYDANGNVLRLVDTGGNVAASYDYDPFGGRVYAHGWLAAANPFRFSTKPVDSATQKLNYGQRWYDPELGRFLNRDPIGEQGGVNLYAACGNDLVDDYDLLGLRPPTSDEQQYVVKMQALSSASRGHGHPEDISFANNLDKSIQDFLGLISNSASVGNDPLALKAIDKALSVWANSSAASKYALTINGNAFNKCNLFVFDVYDALGIDLNGSTGYGGLKKYPAIAGQYANPTWSIPGTKPIGIIPYKRENDTPHDPGSYPTKGKDASPGNIIGFGSGLNQANANHVGISLGNHVYISATSATAYDGDKQVNVVIKTDLAGEPMVVRQVLNSAK